jgi:DNA-binding protein HU-beta
VNCRILKPYALTKADVVSEVASRTGLEKVDVQEVVETFFNVLKTNMSEGNNVYFRGFGSFVVKRRAQKIGRDIARNRSKVIPPHYVPTFKPSKAFAEQVKQNVTDDHEAKEE